MPRQAPSVPLSELLYLAYASEHGISVRGNDLAGGIARLRGERARLRDPALSTLRFTLAPTGTNELWITHTPKATGPKPSDADEQTMTKQIEDLEL